MTFIEYVVYCAVRTCIYFQVCNTYVWGGHVILKLCSILCVYMCYVLYVFTSMAERGRQTEITEVMNSLPHKHRDPSID